jgi:hypothetical protein
MVLILTLLKRVKFQHHFLPPDVEIEKFFYSSLKHFAQDLEKFCRRCFLENFVMATNECGGKNDTGRNYAADSVF